MITPPKNKCVIAPIFDADVSKGGIIIPEVAKERCDQGIIKYVGENCGNLVPGMYVLFSGYSGSLIALEDEGTIIVLHKNDIRLILNPPFTEIPGVYFKDKNSLTEYSDYFPATYESLAGLMASTFEHTDFFKKTKILNKFDDKKITGEENKNEY